MRQSERTCLGINQGKSLDTSSSKKKKENKNNKTSVCISVYACEEARGMSLILAKNSRGIILLISNLPLYDATTV